MPNHAKCGHPWTVHTLRLLMSKNSIKNVLENLFLMFGRGKTQNRAKTHRPNRSSMSTFSAIFVLRENGTQSHSAKFLNWGDHVNSVPDLAASPPPRFKTYTVIFTVKCPRFSTSEYTGDFTLENSSLVLTGIWFSVPGFAVWSSPFVKRNDISKVVLKT